MRCLSGYGNLKILLNRKCVKTVCAGIKITCTFSANKCNGNLIDFIALGNCCLYIELRSVRNTCEVSYLLALCVIVIASVCLKRDVVGVYKLYTVCFNRVLCGKCEVACGCTLYVCELFITVIPAVKYPSCICRGIRKLYAVIFNVIIDFGIAQSAVFACIEGNFVRDRLILYPKLDVGGNRRRECKLRTVIISFVV